MPPCVWPLGHTPEIKRFVRNVRNKRNMRNELNEINEAPMCETLVRKRERCTNDAQTMRKRNAKKVYLSVSGPVVSRNLATFWRHDLVI